MAENKDNADAGNELQADENKVVQFGCRVKTKHKEWFNEFQKQFPGGKEAFEALVEGYQSKGTSALPEVKEVTKEVPIALTGTQFICELDPGVFEKARKVRPWIYKEKVLKNEDPKQYANALANHAISFFINEEYSRIVNR